MAGLVEQIVKTDNIDGLPPALLGQLNGELKGQHIISWSEYDLDQANVYSRQFVILTEQRLIQVGSQGRHFIELKDIAEANIIEGLGVDRLSILVNGKIAADIHYSRRHRTTMTRLHRKLQRRLVKNDPAKIDEPQEWLEAVERETEQKSHCPKCGQLIPSYAEGVCPQCLQNRKVLWRLLGVARPYRPQIWTALCLTGVVAALTPLAPILQGHIIDDVSHLNLHRLYLWAGLLIAVHLIFETTSSMRLWLLSRMGTQVAGDLRNMVYSHMHDLSLRYFSKRRTGSLITRVTNDTDRLWDFIVFGSVDLFRNCLMIAILAIVMLCINWKLALVSLLPLPILATASYFYGRKMQRLHGRMWTYWSRMTAVVGDAIPGIKVVKAFANEAREITRFDRRSRDYMDKEIEVHRIWTRLGPLISVTMKLGSILVWLVGGIIVIHAGNKDGVTIGTLVAFTGFVGQFYGPIMELANSNRMVTRAATSAQRVFEVLDTPPEIYSKTSPIIKDRIEGKIEFRNVSFSYEGAQPALREISMTAKAGEMIGLCGPSGAGKSTFVNLICRFYDTTDGQILIDDIDIRDYDVKFLRRQVGIVLQEPYLFHGTISDNIRYGNPEASEIQVIEAAKAANAHNFIVGFPDGYDTMVGERGQSLSGGERQRISIARAILHSPRILILDEATSSVDTETERQIQQALDRLVQGRTTIAIAHRLSTLTAADRLVVLENGRIAEQGSHDELVNKENGVYARLHKLQEEMSSQVAIR